MKNTLQAVAPPNATRNATQTVADNNQPVNVQTMTAEDRQALLAELMQAQQADITPLEQRKLELETELVNVKDQIRALKPITDTLAVYRAVRSAVKAGNKSLVGISKAAGLDVVTVEAMLTKHLTGKDDNAPIFTLKNGEYSLTPKTKTKKS